METIVDTFVTVAPDCPTAVAVVPGPRGGRPTVASVQYELLAGGPYRLTLEDLMYETHVRRAGLSPGEAAGRAGAIRAELFARPYPCMRASALAKTYGWGVHHDGLGRIGLVAVESEAYRRLASGEVAGLTVVPAMRSRRAV